MLKKTYNYVNNIMLKNLWGETMSIKERKMALRQLADIGEDSGKYLLIHYSCENFDNLKGSSPRILSIVVRSINEGSSKSFAIYLEAEKQSIPIDSIKDNCNILELTMLENFYSYIEKVQDKTLIHWNMRDSFYGFEAMENRYKYLAGNKNLDFISKVNKINIAKVFRNIYGKGYIDDPKMAQLFIKNKLSDNYLLKVNKAIEAEKSNDFAHLHLSLLRKVDNIERLITLAIDKRLKTNWKIFNIYDLSPSGIYEFTKNNWLGALVLYFLGVLTVTLFSKFF